MPEVSFPLKILIVHNHYQQRGGEDSVFETECKMLEDAGHVVLRYEKHNSEIGSEKGLGEEKGLGSRGQGLENSNTNSEPRAEPQPKLLSTLYSLLSTL